MRLVNFVELENVGHAWWPVWLEARVISHTADCTVKVVWLEFMARAAEDPTIPWNNYFKQIYASQIKRKSGLDFAK